MSVEFEWRDKQDGIDDIAADDINYLAKVVGVVAEKIPEVTTDPANVWGDDKVPTCGSVTRFVYQQNGYQDDRIVALETFKQQDTINLGDYPNMTTKNEDTGLYELHYYEDHRGNGYGNVRFADDYAREKITTIQNINNHNDYKVHIVTAWDVSTLTLTLDSDASTLAVGDVISIDGGSNYPYCASITAINGNTITVNERIVSKSTGTYLDPTSETHYLYVDGKPNTGNNTFGEGQVALGVGNDAIANATTAFGRDNYASGGYSFVAGRGNQAANYSVALGRNNKSKGFFSFTSGMANKALGNYSTAISGENTAGGDYCFVGGALSKVLGYSSFGFGRSLNINGRSSVGFGEGNLSEGDYSFIVGKGNSVTGDYGFAGGNVAKAGSYSFAFGDGVKAVNRSLSFGSNVVAEGVYSLGFGNTIQALGDYSLAFGVSTNALGYYSLAFGNTVEAKGNNSIAIGDFSKANGIESLAIGSNCEVEGIHSFAFGSNLKTVKDHQIVFGRYNEENSNAIFMLGNGSKSSGNSNAFVVNNDGSAEIQTMGDKDNSIVIKQYVDEQIGNIEGVLDRIIEMQNNLIGGDTE